MQSAGKAGRACADDQDVGVEFFSFDNHARILSEPEEFTSECGGSRSRRLG
jgi:hypothetical protein